MGRGAAGVDVVGLGEGCPPSPIGVWPGRLKIVHFGIYSDKNSQFSIE